MVVGIYKHTLVNNIIEIHFSVVLTKLRRSQCQRRPIWITVFQVPAILQVRYLLTQISLPEVRRNPGYRDPD